jgi:hypothetical protein
MRRNVEGHILSLFDAIQLIRRSICTQIGLFMMNAYHCLSMFVNINSTGAIEPGPSPETVTPRVRESANPQIEWIPITQYQG